MEGQLIQLTRVVNRIPRPNPPGPILLNGANISGDGGNFDSAPKGLRLEAAGVCRQYDNTTPGVLQRSERGARSASTTRLPTAMMVAAHSEQRLLLLRRHRRHRRQTAQGRQRRSRFSFAFSTLFYDFFGCLSIFDHPTHRVSTFHQRTLQL